jgi:hypothetical protein
VHLRNRVSTQARRKSVRGTGLCFHFFPINKIQSFSNT